MAGNDRRPGSVRHLELITDKEKGYRGQPGTPVTTGCRWQKGGLLGRSDESPWPLPLLQVMSPLFPPSPRL